MLWAIEYGDSSSDLDAAGAISWRPWRRVLRVRGDDRVVFLGRLLSNSVVGVAVGDGNQTLLLDNRGKVQAVLDLWIDDGEILLLGEVDMVEAAAATLQRYVLRAAVQIEVLDSHGVLGLTGASALADLPPPLAGVAGRHGLVHGEVEGVSVRALGRAAGGDELELVVAVEDAASAWQALASRATAPLRPTGWAAHEIARVENGVPKQGAELTGGQFPQEACLDAAIDYEKGCYLGQETVARIHYRGHVNQLLVGLRLELPASVGDQLRSDDSEAGRITSAVVSARCGPIALAYVRAELAEPGNELITSTGSGAVTAALPFQLSR